jgi:hypothetical protein
MERASRALEKTDYFLAERLCMEAIAQAHTVHDFERMARIVLPLQEARRQKRQLAVDLSEGIIAVAGDLSIIPPDPDMHPPAPGVYLFQPPLVGAQARTFRELADSVDVPVFVLTREPMTRDGLWPVVSVGATTARIRIPPPLLPPPRTIVRQETGGGGMTRDNLRPGNEAGIPLAWFEDAAERLGDSAIAKVRPDDFAAWRVQDLLEALEACPFHEKLHQRLEEACHQAAREPLPTAADERRIRRQRRFEAGQDPYSF